MCSTVDHQSDWFFLWVRIVGTSFGTPHFANDGTEGLLRVAA